MRLFRAILALCLALSLAVPAAARDWLRADTPGFTVYSDGYPHELERWARKLEKFDALLRMRYKTPDGDAGSKLTVYLLEDRKSVERMVGKKNLAGFYSSSSEGSFAVTNREATYFNDRLSGQMSLFHEYAHHFMYRHFPAAYPAWYREGFAEYVSTVTFDMDWHWTFGLPATHRQKQFGKAPLAIDTILFSNVEDFKPDRRARFYAWSWLLVHMLHSSPERSNQLDMYLRLFNAGARPDQAAKALGDRATLERDLRAYAAQELVHSASSASIAEEADIRITPLDPLHSRLLELDLARKVKKDPEATRTALRELAESHPASADAQLALAMAERDMAIAEKAEDFTLAEAAASKAIAADPRHARAAVVWADLAIRRLARTSGATAADWAAVRRRLQAAIRIDPNDPLALTTLFRSYIRQRISPPGPALQAMQKAFALQPESFEVRLSQAYALALQGRFEQAKATAQVIASDPHASALGKKALDQLNQMQALADRRATDNTSSPMGSLTDE